MKKNIILLAVTVILLCGCAKPSETPSPSEDIPSEQTNDFEKYADSPEFTGISYDENVTPCPSINNKLHYPQILCFHDETVYYADPRDGLRLYSFDGKETERLTEVAAMSPFYLDGEIYFLSASADYIHSESSEKGQLYKYSINSGETVLLSDMAMRNLLVDENGIYYCVYEPKETGRIKTVFYKFDEESGDSEKLSEVNFFQRYGNIELIFAPAEELSDLVIYLKKGDEVYRFLTGVIPSQYGIWNGKFYYIDQNTRVLYSIDLTNGAKEEFGKASDYAVLNGEVYCLVGDKPHKAGDTADPNIVYSILSDQTEDEQIQENDYHFLHLYTTGSELYALVEWYTENGASENSIARITNSENGVMLVELLA